MTDAEAFVSFKPKLQAKLQTLQSEIATYKRELADMKVENEALEGRLQDQSEQLEMAMLDREVAEEKAEAAEADLEAEKELRSEREVELNVLKEQLEGTPISPGGDGAADEENGAKSSLDYIQLEKQNERLKEALIRYVILGYDLLSNLISSIHCYLRLRDITHEAEVDNRRKVADLEHELSATDEMQCQSSLVNVPNSLSLTRL